MLVVSSTNPKPCGVPVLSLPQGWRGHSNGQLLPVNISPLLGSAAELVMNFSQFADVVVSVARKTDASLWPALFTAIGSPGALLEHLLDTGALKSAACFLLVRAMYSTCA